MNWVSAQVLRWRKAVIVIFVCLVALCGLAAFTLHINYDMTAYLPKQANSTQALAIMRQNFAGDLPDTNVMLPVSGIAQAKEYKAAISKVPGVSTVIWLDDSVDLATPLAALDSKTVSTYYKAAGPGGSQPSDSQPDGQTTSGGTSGQAGGTDQAGQHYALYQVAVKSGQEQAAVTRLKQLAGGRAAVSGNAVDMADSQSMALSQSTKALALLVPIILVILILATRSWVEPVLYLLAIGASIVINLGITALMGDISFISMAVVPILQLAVALDYAVFLSTAYTRARAAAEPPTGSTKQATGQQTGDGPDSLAQSIAAMRTAMRQSATSIFASALAGVAAFTALIFMNFRIGPDMGWGLVRGVIISYICVIVLLPALIIVADKLIRKTSHRRLLPTFQRTSSALVRIRIPALIIVILLTIPAWLGQARNSFIYGSGQAAAGSVIAKDKAAIEKVFGVNNSLVVLVPRGDPAAEAQLDAAILGLSGVKSLVSYTAAVGAQIPPAYLGDIADTFYSKAYARLIATVSTPSEGPAAFKLVRQTQAAVAALYPGRRTYLAGQSASMYDMKTTVAADDKRVDAITIIAIFVVLLILFRSLLLPVLTLLAIKSAIVINMAVPYFMGTSLSFVGYLVVSVIMMGSAIDYGILLLDHYLVERRSMSKLPAMRAALRKAIPAMLVSALILTLAGLTLGLTSTSGIVGAIGWLVGRGGIIAFVICLTLLPALLLVCDRLIPKLSLGLHFFEGQPGSDPASSSRADDGQADRSAPLTRPAPAGGPTQLIEIDELTRTREPTRTPRQGGNHV